jgi:hypothetical protein
MSPLRDARKAAYRRVPESLPAHGLIEPRWFRGISGNDAGGVAPKGVGGAG